MTEPISTAVLVFRNTSNTPTYLSRPDWADGSCWATSLKKFHQHSTWLYFAGVLHKASRLVGLSLLSDVRRSQIPKGI